MENTERKIKDTKEWAWRRAVKSFLPSQGYITVARIARRASGNDTGIENRWPKLCRLRSISVWSGHATSVA
jgi:hypothetical protein